MDKNKDTIVKLSLTTMLMASPLPAAAQTINCIQPLTYGSILACGSGNPVTVTPSNSRTAGGCLTAFGPFSIGRCIVTQGFPFRAVKVSVTAASINLSNGGGNLMAVTSFNIITNAGGRTTIRTVPFLSVPIGATLNVGANQVAGNYTGSFTVSAVFQ